MLTNEQTIDVVRNLPDQIMELRGVYLPLNSSTDPEGGKLINHVRKQYRSIATWLEYYLCNNTQALTEIRLTNKKHYKCFAENFKTNLDLAHEIYIQLPKYPVLKQVQELTIAPLEWTLGCQVDILETELKNSGYTGTPIQMPAKRELEAKAKQFYDKAEDCGAYKSSQIELLTDSELVKTQNRLELLHDVGLWIADNETPEFRDDGKSFKFTYWSDFCKAKKRYFSSLRKLPLKGIYLDQGGKYQICSGKRRKNNQEKSKRGFAN